MFHRGCGLVLELEKNVWRFKLVKPPNHFLTYEDNQFLLDGQPIYKEEVGKFHAVQLCGDRYVGVRLDGVARVHDCTTHEVVFTFTGCSTNISYFNGNLHFTPKDDYLQHYLDLKTFEIYQKDKEPFKVHKVTRFNRTHHYDHEIIVNRYYGCKGKLPLLSIAESSIFSDVQVCDSYLLVPTDAEIVVTPGDEFTLVPMQSEYGQVFEMVRMKSTTKPALRVVADDDD